MDRDSVPMLDNPAYVALESVRQRQATGKSFHQETLIS